MKNNKKKVLIIINPISGVRPKTNIPSLIYENIDLSKFSIQIEYTEYAGHATEIANDAVKSGIKYIIAIGGDGTINEVAKALVQTDTALGIVPQGSGNGLARHLQISLDTTKALKAINDEHIVSIDYCMANDHIFFCTAGIGFDAWISQKFSEDKHRGSMTYFKNALTEYIKYEPRYYKLITSEGLTVEKAFLVAIGNASQYGNNAYIAPEASMQDGLMDITILEPFNAFDVPQLAIQLFTKQINKNRHITTIKDKSVKIITENEEVMHIDGEPIKLGKEINIKTIPKGLKVITPRNPSKSIIEPIQYAIEEIHYNFLNDIRGVFKLNTGQK